MTAPIVDLGPNEDGGARPPPPLPLRGSARRRLAEMMRVDHAGELGAVHIYRGQHAAIRDVKGKEKLSRQIAEMQAHEERHLKAFEAILAEREVRPTLLAPLWRAAGFALGAASALIGPKAAHACTEAVETVIEGHYAEQIAEVRERDPALAETLGEFRADELAHRDLARGAGAAEAFGGPLLGVIVRFGCRAAIRISEKI